MLKKQSEISPAPGVLSPKTATMKHLGTSPGDLSMFSNGDSPRKNKGLSLLKQMMDKNTNKTVGRIGIPGDDNKKNIADLMKNLALNLKAETETRKAIKSAPVEISDFKNIMRIMNKIYEKQGQLDELTLKL